MRVRSVFPAFLAAVACFSPAWASTVVVGASHDNTLYEDAAGSLSNGAGTYFFAGTTLENEKRRGLVAFDLSDVLPAGAVVTDASLTLHMSRTISGDADVSLSRASAGWGEAGSNAPNEEGGGAPSQPGDATWLHSYYDTQFWATPGGDFSPTPSATTSVGNEGFYTWSGAQLLADVQQWLASPGTNYGWLLLGDESQYPSAKRFDTREATDPANRPALTITYVPEPGALAGLVLGAVALRRRTARA